MKAAASLVILGAVASTTLAQDVITEDAYFYGLSEPVYPTPNITGLTAEWAQRAKAFVDRMTLEEAANLTVGYPATNKCSGQLGTIPRLGFTGICTTGAGNGIRQTELVSGWPAAIHIGASFNKKLSHDRGIYMGKEFRLKGSHLAGGPVMGPLGRVGAHGRNWESFSTDPYLCGKMAGLTVEGIQAQGVGAMPKHYVGYEQQTNRLPGTRNGVFVDAYSLNLDDRTLHEIYTWPFAETVKAGAVAVVCSYNRLNNSNACQNSKALNGILKGELGFPGWVLSDWGAQQSGVASALAGLDVAMPNSRHWGVGGSALVEMVRNGSVPESIVRDTAMRIIGGYFKMGQDKPDYPPCGMAPDLQAPHLVVNARNPEARPILMAGALEGHVLVKNMNNALPLKKPTMLSIFGYDAPAPRVMNIPPVGTGAGALNGNGWATGTQSVNLSMSFPNGDRPVIATLGTLVSGGGSGATAPPYMSGPFEALQEQAYKDDTAYFWDFESSNPRVAYASDACLVFINAYAEEGYDRQTVRDDFSDALVKNVASKCNNTIVTMHNVGMRLVDQWIDHPNVTAVIFAHLPGQDSGRAVVKLLYGEENFSGKLPYTVAKNETDHHSMFPVRPEGRYVHFPQMDATEGIFIDHRWYDQKGVEPRFEFGFGLSYTTFSFAGLGIEKLPGRLSTPGPVGGIKICGEKASSGPSNGTFPTNATAPTNTTSPSSNRVGGHPALWKDVVTVKATVTNTGSVAGAEVAQLYLGIPSVNGDTPVRQLRGFEKPVLQPGASSVVEFKLMRKDLSIWDSGAQDWVLRKGEYKVYIGSSSRTLPLEGSFTIE